MLQTLLSAVVEICVAAVCFLMAVVVWILVLAYVKSVAWASEYNWDEFPFFFFLAWSSLL